MKKTLFIILSVLLVAILFVSCSSSPEHKANKTTYTVSFDMQNHGTQIDPIADVESGAKITKPTDPTATGYTFGGWYKESECSNKWDFNSNTVTAATTLYAKWTINTYTVSFDMCGHGTQVDSIENVEYGSKITKPTDPTAAGYTFTGWTKVPGFVNWDFNTDTVSANTTIFANWTPDE